MVYGAGARNVGVVRSSNVRDRETRMQSGLTLCSIESKDVFLRSIYNEARIVHVECTWLSHVRDMFVTTSLSKPELREVLVLACGGRPDETLVIGLDSCAHNSPVPKSGLARGSPSNG